MAITVFPRDAVLRSLDANWTAADWEQLPDDGQRYEIIAGVLYLSGPCRNCMAGQAAGGRSAGGDWGAGRGASERGGSGSCARRRSRSARLKRQWKGTAVSL